MNNPSKKIVTFQMGIQEAVCLVSMQYLGSIHPDLDDTYRGAFENLFGALDRALSEQGVTIDEYLYTLETLKHGSAEA